MDVHGFNQTQNKHQ